VKRSANVMPGKRSRRSCIQRHMCTHTRGAGTTPTQTEARCAATHGGAPGSVGCLGANTRLCSHNARHPPPAP
jgi:hypothetical protein